MHMYSVKLHTEHSLFFARRRAGVGLCVAVRGVRLSTCANIYMHQRRARFHSVDGFVFRVIATRFENTLSTLRSHVDHLHGALAKNELLDRSRELCKP